MFISCLIAWHVIWSVLLQPAAALKNLISAEDDCVLGCCVVFWSKSASLHGVASQKACISVLVEAINSSLSYFNRFISVFSSFGVQHSDLYSIVGRVIII